MPSLFPLGLFTELASECPCSWCAVAPPTQPAKEENRSICTQRVQTCLPCFNLWCRFLGTRPTLYPEFFQQPGHAISFSFRTFYRVGFRMSMQLMCSGATDTQLTRAREGGKPEHLHSESSNMIIQHINDVSISYTSINFKTDYQESIDLKRHLKKWKTLKYIK